MKPPPPPIVSMRYLVPGARVLNPNLIPADLVISTNSIGLDSFLAVCPGVVLANGQITQSVEISQTIRIVFIEILKLISNRESGNNCTAKSPRAPGEPGPSWNSGKKFRVQPSGCWLATRKLKLVL